MTSSLIVTPALYVQQGPPCSQCGQMIDDVTMASVIWDRWLDPEITVFDGFHLVHKRCDPARSYMKSEELLALVDSPESLLYFLGEALGEAAAQETISPDHWANVTETLGWVYCLQIELMSRQEPDLSHSSSTAGVERAAMRVRARARRAQTSEHDLVGGRSMEGI